MQTKFKRKFEPWIINAGATVVFAGLIYLSYLVAMEFARKGRGLSASAEEARASRERIANMEKWGYPQEPKRNPVLDAELPAGTEPLGDEFKADPYEVAERLWNDFPKESLNMHGHEKSRIYAETQYVSIEVRVVRTPKGFEIQCRPIDTYRHIPSKVVEFAECTKGEPITLAGIQDVGAGTLSSLEAGMNQVASRLNDLQKAMLAAPAKQGVAAVPQ